jgi:hypothetical protein
MNADHAELMYVATVHMGIKCIVYVWMHKAPYLWL